MFKLCQILFVVCFAIGIIAHCRKKRQHKISVPLYLVMLLVVSAFCSNAILQQIPLPTDKVVVSASGEKDSQATTNEIWIKGYSVGGEEYPLKNPSEGKWFWEGSTYKWRDESDLRQPKGTTRSITLDISYGRDRTIQFYANEWSGVVEVTDHGNLQQYDLFPVNGETIVNAAITDTDSLLLYTTKLLRLAFFCAVVTLFMTYPCYAANKFSDEQIKTFFSRNWSRFAYSLLAICCFAVMFCNGGRESFWGDEVWTLGWIYLGNPDKFLVYQWLNDLWFSLMPYGQEYLLILPEIFVAISVYVAGRTGELYKGKRLGVIMAALLASSPIAMIQGGGEFRPYALLIFATFGLLYFYIKKQREQSKRKPTLVIYVLLLLLVMNTHPFGVVLSGLMMLSDFILIILKKRKPVVLLEFILPCLYAVYWVFNTIKNNGGLLHGSGIGWVPQPSLRGVVSIYQWLCSSNNLIFALLLIGIAVTLVYLVGRHRWKGTGFEECYTLLTLLGAPIALTALTFLYPIIFKGTSVFFFRYFTVLLPYVIFFVAVAIDMVIEILSQKACGAEGQISSICILSCVSVLCVLNWNYLPNNNLYEFYGGEDFRGTAEYLMSQNDIYEPYTICLIYGNKYQNAGFEYYLTQKGRRDSIYHVSAVDEVPNNLYEYKTIYCVYHHSNVHPYSSPFIENGYTEEYSNESLALIKFVKR